MAKLTPYAWQERDVQTLWKHNYTGLLAVEAGGAKTFLSVLTMIDMRPDVTLIIAPKSTHATAWIPTVRDNYGVTPRILGNGKKDQKEAMTDFELGYPGVYLITPQLLTRTDVSGWRGDLLIFDEIHMGGVTAKSKGQRKVSGYYPTDGEPLNRRFRSRLALSATPFRSDFSNAWGVMRFLWPELDEPGQIADQNLYRWQAERMDYGEIVTGVEWFEVPEESYPTPPEGYWKKRIDGEPHWGKPKTVKDYYGEAEPGRLYREMPCVISHKRRETCCSEPTHQGGFLTVAEPQIIHREVELTATQKRNIRDMDRMMLTYVKDQPLEATISLTQRQRIRQLAMAEATVEAYEIDGEEKSRVSFDPDAKSPIIEEIRHILDNLPEDETVVIFSDSQKFAETITHQLNKAHIPAAEYSGVRKADLNMFGEAYRVLVGVTSAIGTGTDGLQSKCSTEIYADQPISLTMKIQSTARLERMNSTKRVQRYIILDDMGVAEGRLEDLWAQELSMAKSLR